MSAGTEVVVPWGQRKITHAFHDIDGTHSLIRDWVPVMELVIGWVIENGIDGIDSQDSFIAKILSARKTCYPMAKDFAIESAGLSALTQMEWALRNALKQGTLMWKGRPLPPVSLKINDLIIAQIFAGKEHSDEYGESMPFKTFLRETSSKLFKVYEQVLLIMSRNQNLKAARSDPERWRVPGSMSFLQKLKSLDIKNYFVTGAVVEHNADGSTSGTMYEEIVALGYQIGERKLVEKLCGSDWNQKVSKQEIFDQICVKEGLAPENIMIIGDGRSEISAGQQMGALTISRLNKSAARQRTLHRKLGTNLIIADYCSAELMQIFS